MPFMGRPQAWEEAAAYVADVARGYGYDEEQVKAFLAVMKTEGGWRGAAGDTSGTGARGAGSYSAWQLNFHPGNPGTRFARAMGMSNDEAKRYLSENPLAPTEWWLDPNNDLGKAVHQGRAQGLTGPALATYAQRHGQRSIEPQTAGANYSALFGGGQAAPSGSHLMSQEGGGGVVSDVGAGYVATEGEELTGTITPERIAQLVAQHGQYTATVKPGTENRKRIIRGVETDLTEKNPDPTWVVVFADGSKVEVKGERDDEGNASGNWLPVAGSAALKAPTTKTPSGAPSTGLWMDLGDGRRLRIQQGPNGELTPAPNPLDPTQPLIDAGGRQPPRERTATQEAASQAQAVLAWARARQVGQPTPLDPITAQLRQAQTQRVPYQAAADMARAGAQEALAGKYETQALVEARKLVPKQLLVMQEADQTLRAIAQAYQSGAITAEERDGRHQAAIKYMEAGLRGTTPAEEEKLRQEAITERAQIGRDLINRRSQTAAQLSGDLQTTFRETMKDMLVPPGGYDPVGHALFTAAGLHGDLATPNLNEVAMGLIAGLEPSKAGGFMMPGVTPASLSGPSGEMELPGVTPASLAPPGGAQQTAAAPQNPLDVLLGLTDTEDEDDEEEEDE